MSVLNYIDVDFDDLVIQLTNKISESAAWEDAYRSGTGQMLVELLAYISNLDRYYIERRAEELYLATSQLKSSVINIVKLLNYDPRRNVSATGTAKFSIPSPSTKNIFLTKYTRLETVDGVKYVVDEDGVLLAGNTEVNVGVIQGEKIDIQITSNGAASQRYNVEDSQIENSNIDVFVDGEQWTAVSSFFESTTESKEYNIRTENDETLTIKFGDGVKGKIPPNGSIILIRYIRSIGTDGNIYATNKLTVIKDNIFDEDGVIVSDVSVTNANTILGGDDAETVEEIKENAPAVFSTGDRLVIVEDYIAYLNSVASVADSNAWGEREENPPNVDMFNRVKISLILDNWAFANQEFLDSLTAELYNRAQLTVLYEFINPDIIQLIPVIDINVLEGFSLSAVQTAVENAFVDLFLLGTTTRIGVSKYLSDVTSVIDAVTGVDNFRLVLLGYKELQAGYDSFYDYGETLDLLSILEESVEVYIGTENVAIDDGVGGFTDLSSLYTVSGVINYTTGVIGIDISPSPVGDITVRYKQNENGDLIVTKNQILRLNEVDVTSIQYSS
jgi:hypothetical protein